MQVEKVIALTSLRMEVMPLIFQSGTKSIDIFLNKTIRIKMKNCLKKGGCLPVKGGAEKTRYSPMKGCHDAFREESMIHDHI